MGLQVKNYSEKSFVVLGETKEHKEKLKELGGRFNKFLKVKGKAVEGWIFGKKRMPQVKEFVKSVNA